MTSLTDTEIRAIDRQHIWHPYASMTEPLPVYNVSRAKGVYLELHDGRRLIDGMASWWCAIHGYNHPRLNAALSRQAGDMAHVMFGGIIHEPAARLARHLIELSPPGLDKVFFSDSGSVSVEVAIKMALQYWQSRGQVGKNRLLSLRRAYHGDTFAAMSVCDPVTGMHQLFNEVLRTQVFSESPRCEFGAEWEASYLQDLEQQLRDHHRELAALILEPVVQGAGGMRFYSPQYLAGARALCDRYQVLLIADEIATGFGRSGKLFACEWAGISPDIMCIGKALTGGYMSLAATLCSEQISDTICKGEAGVFMHGPTFMGNPLACAVATENIEMLLESPWQQNIARIEAELKRGLAPCASYSNVADVRVLGAIGVVEMREPVDVAELQRRFVEAGIWVRPFSNLVYVMPPYIIDSEECRRLCDAMVQVLQPQH